MPNIKSAKNRVKVTSVKTLQNKIFKTQYKNIVKKFYAAVEAGDKNAAEVMYKEAVKKEYHRLKYRRFLTSILVLVVIFVLGIFAFDAIRVNYYEGEPILYKKSRVDGGYLYKGVGYGKLYCDNGNNYFVVIYDGYYNVYETTIVYRILNEEPQIKFYYQQRVLGWYTDESLSEDSKITEFSSLLPDQHIVYLSILLFSSTKKIINHI